MLSSFEAFDQLFAERQLPVEKSPRSWPMSPSA
jgi:hypothetical protein